MKRTLRVLFFTMMLSPAITGLATDSDQPTVSIGSKNFPESYLLAELMAQLLEDAGWKVQRRFGLGGTLICYQALLSGEIDLYPEYTGTIALTILNKRADLTKAQIDAELTAQGLIALDGFGFNNTYALTLTRARAQQKQLTKISQLKNHPELRVQVSHEFLQRADGWPALSAAYQLPQKVTGIEHSLAYQAMANDKIDITDAYSTDGDIAYHDLTLLQDDLDFFPQYFAVPLLKKNLRQDLSAIIEPLLGSINEATMQGLNSQVMLEKTSVAVVAAAYLRGRGLLQKQVSEAPVSWFKSTLLKNIGDHLLLTLMAISLAGAIAFLLATNIYANKTLGNRILYLAGLLQTIPSIALLALLIPFTGIGALTAVIALFLYALLPILQASLVALRNVDPVLTELARGMGMTKRQCLYQVELPLALPHMLAGLKTATIITIGTATLAGFIGAGGLGGPIFTGLALNDAQLILEGAVPAAALAILVALLFDFISQYMTPRQ